MTHDDRTRTPAAAPTRAHHTELLRAEEEPELAIRIALGKAASERLAAGTSTDTAADTHLAADGQHARQRFILANTRLAYKWANTSPLRHLPGVDIDDLCAAALDGLIVAVDRYDPNMGTKFSTYAVHWIRQRMQRHARNAYGPSFSHREVATDNQVATATRTLTQELGRTPSAAEVAHACRLLTSEVHASTRRLAARSVISLDATLADSGRTLADLLEGSTSHDSATSEDAHARTQTIKDAVGHLPGDQRRIVILGFGLDGHPARSARELVSASGLPAPRVSELLSQALTTLHEDTRLRRLVRTS